MFFSTNLRVERGKENSDFGPRILLDLDSQRLEVHIDREKEMLLKSEGNFCFPTIYE